MPTLVPHLAWWRRTHRGLPAGSPPAQTDTSTPFPAGPLPVAVDLYMFGNWLDVTGFVYQRDKIVIGRGRTSEGGVGDPTSIALTFDNRDGRFSPRNPVGVWYGQLGRNTPLRVRVGNDPRAVGEVPAWVPKWDTTGTDVWVTVAAAGILRRLQQGDTPLRSTWDQALTALTPAPVAYWPCEDASGATSVASAVGGPAMTIIGATPTFANNTDFAASDPVLTLSDTAGGGLQGVVPTYPSTGVVQHRWLMSIPAAGILDATAICDLRTGGTVGRWRVEYGTGGTLRLRGFAAAGGAEVLTSSAFAMAANGAPMLVSLELSQSGADVAWALRTLPVGATVATSGTGTFASNTVTAAVRVNYGIGGYGLGHVSVHDTIADITTLADQLSAYAGEAAGRRIERLCSDAGISFVAAGDLDDTAAMGAQATGKLMDLLREAETTDLGVLYEPRDRLGLAYLPRSARYNRDVSVTLDYSAGQLSALDPVDDDQNTRNQVTVTRAASGSATGSSATASLDTGALSTLDPPDGVGPYPTQVTVNTETDDVLADQAGWRLHLGTVDEPRFPQVGVNLARVAITADASLVAALTALDVGGRVAVTSPPSQASTADISQEAAGFVETLNAFERSVTVNCVPESPWQVAVYDDDGSRYSSDGTTLAAEAAAGVTSLSVATASGPLWVDVDGPFDWLISGEQVTVTAISGVTSPQTATVTRGVNGVAKTLPAGSAVVLAHPAVYAL